MKMLWAVLLGVFAVYLLYPLRAVTTSEVVAPQAAVLAAKAPVSALPPVTGELVLKRAANGHFYGDGRVNGATVRFIVDTGATTVALTRADAQRAGLSFNDAEFTGTAHGAGGVIATKPVMLDNVAFGSFEAARVDGVIVKGDLDVSLLGQSWLKHVGSVTISGDTMTLR